VPSPSPSAEPVERDVAGYRAPVGGPEATVTAGEEACRTSGPDTHQICPAAGHGTGHWPGGDGPRGISGKSDEEIDAAAVSACRASVDTGRPLSERKLAAMFGKTSRRWARNRIAEARQVAFVPAMVHY